jgi:hypothetical protein
MQGLQLFAHLLLLWRDLCVVMVLLALCGFLKYALMLLLHEHRIELAFLGLSLLSHLERLLDMLNILFLESYGLRFREVR